MLVTSNNYPSEFLKVQWLNFTDVMNNVTIACQIFSGFHILEVIKIGPFLTELLKLKMPSLFRNTVFIDRTGIDLLKEGIISEWTLGTISKGTSSGLL